MRDVIDRLSELGLDTARVRVMGGGATSGPGSQIRADLLCRPIETLAEADTSAMGAAVLAAVAAGDAATVGEACGRLELSVRSVDPVLGNCDAHETAYRRYRALFEALAPTFS